MKKMLTVSSFLLLVFLSGNAQVGIGTSTPGTTLDVNGAVTCRETAVAVTANAVTIPVNVSLVRLTGVATASIGITVPAAPNAGQRLIIFNNTTGGFTAVLNGFNIPFSQSAEFVYSNGGWQSLLPSGSSIIPYASALPATVTTLASGLEGTVATLGFGNSVSGIGLSGSTINLTGGAGINLNFGFVMPRAGVVKSIAVVYSNAVAASLTGTTVTLKVQLYSNSTNNNLFTAVPGASVVLSPGLTGTVAVGDVFTGNISGLAIPVSSQSRLLLIVSATATGLSLVNTAVGYISAGVSFD